MNEEYLQRLYEHLGVSEDFNSFVNKLQTDESYSQEVHSNLGISSGYDDWYKYSFGDKKKESTESQSTGVQEVTPSDSGVAETADVETSNGVSTELIFNLNDFNTDLYNASESLYKTHGGASLKWDIDHGMHGGSVKKFRYDPFTQGYEYYDDAGIPIIDDFQKNTTDFLNKYGISNLDDFRKVLNAEIGNEYTEEITYGDEVITRSGGIYDEVLLEGQLSAVQELIDYNNKAQENLEIAQMVAENNLTPSEVEAYRETGIMPESVKIRKAADKAFDEFVNPKSAWELSEERFLPLTAQGQGLSDHDRIVTQEEDVITKAYQAERKKFGIFDEVREVLGEITGTQTLDFRNTGSYRNGLYYPTIEEQKEYKLIDEKYGEQVAIEQYKWAKHVSEYRRRNFFHSYTEREIIKKTTELLNKVSDGDLAIVTGESGDLVEVWNSDWNDEPMVEAWNDVRDVYKIAQRLREEDLNRKESWSYDAYMQDTSVPESDKTGDNRIANYSVWKAKKIDEVNLERAAVYYNNDVYYDRAMRKWGHALNKVYKGESVYQERMDKLIEQTSSYRETHLALTDYFSYSDALDGMRYENATQGVSMEDVQYNMRMMDASQERVVNAAIGIGLLPADFEIATLSEDEKAELMQSLRDKVSYTRGSLEAQMLDLTVASKMDIQQDEYNKFQQAKRNYESGNYDGLEEAMGAAGYDPGDDAIDFLANMYRLYNDYEGPASFPYTRSWTTDWVLNRSNDIGIFFSDAFGSSEYAEQLQQYKQSRRIQADLELGLDPYDNRTATEMFQDGDDDLAWTKIFLQVSETMPYLIVGAAAPQALPGMAGTTAFFETYENYRDRGDLTEGQKISLAISASAIEGTITWIGMGNIRATRANLGIADDIGTQTIAARRAAYTRAVNYLLPKATRVQSVLLSPTARGVSMGAMMVAAEEVEELAIAAGVMASARVIAGDEFRPEVLGDVALTTAIASGPTMGITNTVTEYNNTRVHQRLSEAALGVDLAGFMELSDLRQGIKEAMETINVTDASPEQQTRYKALEEEYQRATEELNSIKSRALERTRYMPDNVKAQLADINRQIVENVDAYDASEDAMVRDAITKKVEDLIRAKTAIESRYDYKYILNGEEMNREDFIEAIKSIAKTDPDERGDYSYEIINDDNTTKMVDVMFGYTEYVKGKPKAAVEEEEVGKVVPVNENGQVDDVTVVNENSWTHKTRSKEAIENWANSGRVVGANEDVDAFNAEPNESLMDAQTKEQNRQSPNFQKGKVYGSGTKDVAGGYVIVSKDGKILDGDVVPNSGFVNQSNLDESNGIGVLRPDSRSIDNFDVYSVNEDGSLTKRSWSEFKTYESTEEGKLPKATPEQKSESALTEELNTDDIGIRPADGKPKSLKLDEELSYDENGSVGIYVNKETGDVEAIVALPDRKTDASYVAAEKTGENEYSLNIDISEGANISGAIDAVSSALPQGSTLRVAPEGSISTDALSVWSNKIEEGYTPTEETVSVPVNGKGETDLGGRPSDANNPDSPLEFDTEEDAIAAAKIVEESVADIPGATVWTRTESLGRGKERHTVSVTLPKLEAGEKAAAPETTPTDTETENIFSPETIEADGQKPVGTFVNESGETIVETKQERRERRSKQVDEIAQDITEEESQQLLEEAEEETAKEKKEIEERSKKPFILTRWYETLVFRDARLKKAVKKGLGDYAGSMVERRYNAAGYVSKEMQVYIKQIFGQDVKVFGRGITNIQVTEGKASMIDRVALLRSIIDIDERFDSRRREAEQKLSNLEAEYKELVASYEAATGDTKKEIAKQIKDSGIKQEIKELSKALEAGEYNRPTHPNDMTSEKAMRELAALKNKVGVDEYNDINSRVNYYYTAMEDVLLQARDSGLIDDATYQRFVVNDYSRRIFLSKLFGDVDDTAFDGFKFPPGTNKKEFIQSLRDGSNESVLTDTALLLELTLRAVKTRGHQNKLLSIMHNLAKEKNYEGVDFMAEANVDKNGNVLEADKGFFNVDYFVDGKRETFQVRVDLAAQLMGQYKTYFTPEQRKKISRYTGSKTMKTLATGTSTAFALTAALRYPFEVVYGRGVYDKYAFTPIMLGYATFDLSLGLKDAVLNTEIVEEYAKAGGLTDLLTSQGTPAKRTQEKRKGGVSRFTGKLKEGAWHTVSWAGNKSELAARIAIYKRAKSNLKKKYPDMPEEQIQSIAVEESLMLANFSASGTLGRDIESFTPYFNAALQGTRGWIEYASENPKMFTFKMAQTFGVTYSLNTLLMGQLTPEEYEAISDHEKKLYYLIYMGRDEKGRPELFKIPKAHVVLGIESAAIKTSEYTKAMQEGSEYVWEEDEDWMGFITDAFSTSVVPPLPVYIDDMFEDPKFAFDVPFLKMMVAYNYNQDMFRDEKIYKGEEDILEYMKGQRDDNTEDFMKALSLEFASLGFEFSPQKGQRAMEQILIGDRNIIIDKLYDAANWAVNYGDHFEELQEEYGIIPEEHIVEQNFRNGLITEEEYNDRMEDIVEVNDDLSTLVGGKGRIKLIDLERAYVQNDKTKRVRTEQTTRKRLFKNYVLDAMKDVELIQDDYGNYIVPNPIVEDILKYAEDYEFDLFMDVDEMMSYALYLGRKQEFLSKDVEPILFSKSGEEAISAIEFALDSDIKYVSIPELNDILTQLENAGMSEKRLNDIMAEYRKATGVVKVKAK